MSSLKPVIDCRHFNGYKPCGRSAICDSLCPQMRVDGTRILIIHLEALGAVVRSTALLAPIRRKFPNAHITWVTQKPADHLLANLPNIDRVLTTSPDDLLQLSVLEFDVGFIIDKGLKSAGVLKLTSVDFLYGFTVDSRTGAVIPATPAADELWHIGLSNQKKFFENQKPEIQLAHEALELGPWIRDEYDIRLTDAERAESNLRRERWLGGRKVVVGLNTGCSGTILAKRLTIDTQREIIERLLGRGDVSIVLLGGPEDTLRNESIGFDLPATLSPTTAGLRDGLVSVEACDVVISGDSLGMHMAIALRKWTVAWFGPTCAHEIDLFDRGARVLTQASCSPCWKRSCDKQPMCYDMVSVDEIIAHVERAPAFESPNTTPNIAIDVMREKNDGANTNHHVSPAESSAIG